MTHNLAGVFPPIPTPFRADGSVDWKNLEANLKILLDQPVRGLVVGGSNGEFVFLNEEEQLAVVTFVRERLSEDFLLIAGSGAESTIRTTALTQRVADAGADVALVITPSYYTSKMTPAALLAHYGSVAKNSPIPLLLYNMPANTGVDMRSTTICELSQHGNILGIKDSSGKVDKLAEVVAHSAPGFQVLAGSAGFFLPALTVGAVGCVAALANIAAPRLRSIESSYRAGDLKIAQTEQAALVRINSMITAVYGVAGLKAAMDLLGLYGGPVRLPLMDLPTEAREQIRTELIASDLLSHAG